MRRSHAMLAVTAAASVGWGGWGCRHPAETPRPSSPPTSAVRPETSPTIAPRTDPELPFPEYATWVGASADEALLLVGSWRTNQRYFAAVELAGGCVVDTYARFDAVWGVGGTTQLTDDLKAQSPSRGGALDQTAANMSSAAFREEVAALAALLKRFSVRRLPGMFAASADGARLLFAAGDWMYRSRDGGRTFQRLDALPSYEPDVSADGKWGAYRRCDRHNHQCRYRLTVVPLDSDGPPVFLGDAQVHDLRFAPDGRRVIFARATDRRGDFCIETADLSSRTVSRVACARTKVIADDSFFVSPNVRFGVMAIYDAAVPINSGLRLYSLPDGRVLRDLPGAGALVPPISDAGMVAWAEKVEPPRMVHLTGAAGDRAAGEGDPLGFDARGRLVVETSAIASRPREKLGPRACGLVRAIDVSPSALPLEASPPPRP